MEEKKSELENNEQLKPVIDTDGYYSFTKKKGKDFKILQLTDLHIGSSIFTIKRDKMAFKLIDKVVKEANPDLIIITGDMIFPIPVIGGTPNNGRATKMVGKFMEKFGIPWTVVYGNHDTEPCSFCGKSKLTRYYENFENCLFQRGPEEISGQGNYIIKLKNEDGSLNNALVCIDSNMYIDKGLTSFYSGFDSIHNDQMEWYKKEILKLSEGRDGVIPSLAFFHIPFYEYKEAWRKFSRKDNTEVKYFCGNVGETNDYFGVPKFRDNTFKTMVDLGSTKGTFCGHDHLNTVSMEYKGIRLTYGMSVDYLAYRHILKWSSQRGGTIITIDDNSKFDIDLLPYDDIKEEE